jgi:hypothetical protein
MKIKSLCLSLGVILGLGLSVINHAQAQEVIYNSDGTISTWQNGEEIITDSNGTILQIIQQPMPESDYYYQPEYIPYYIPAYGSNYNDNNGYDRNHGHHADGRWQQPQAPTATNVYPQNSSNNHPVPNNTRPSTQNSPNMSHGNSTGNNANPNWQNR